MAYHILIGPSIKCKRCSNVISPPYKSDRLFCNKNCQTKWHIQRTKELKSGTFETICAGIKEKYDSRPHSMG